MSDQFYSFNRETGAFQTLAPLPTPRYRHAAVLVNKQLWLVGGRDVTDAMISTVDVRIFMFCVLCFVVHFVEILTHFCG